jgi:hypothetical protein
MIDQRPKVSAVLNLDEASVASAALAESVHEAAGYLVGHLGTVIEKGEHAPIAGQDAEATARQLVAGIAALNEIGWPHELAERISSEGEAAG